MGYNKGKPAMFQSAPAIAGGRCAKAKALLELLAVSIRARHCWRAMPFRDLVVQHW